MAIIRVSRYFDDWVDFCMSRDPIKGVWYGHKGITAVRDYDMFLKDLALKVPRAEEFAIAFTKYKMPRS